MKVMTTNCLKCKSPIELVFPEEVLQLITEDSIFKFTCIHCSATFGIKLSSSTLKENSLISDRKLGANDSESKDYDPIGPRPQIVEINELSESDVIPNMLDIFVK